MRYAAALLLFAGLAACTTFPAIDAAVGKEVQALPFPRIAPLDALIAGANVPPDGRQSALDAKAAALRARAQALRAVP